MLSLNILYAPLSFGGSVQQYIDATSVWFIDVFDSGDRAKVASLYTPDAGLLPPDSSIIVGRSAIEEFWQGAMDAFMKLKKLQAVEVDSRGDIAYEVGEFVLAVPGEIGTTDVHGKYIVV